MNKELQRIKIAEFCGWADMGGSHKNVPWGYDPQDGRLRIIPDYLNDLNAMHEVEMSLWHSPHDALLPDHYVKTLRETCRETSHYSEVATAAQRAEAFLKTLNLWTVEND